MIGDPLKQSGSLQDIIANITAGNPALVNVLGGQATFNQTLANIGTLDSTFQSRGAMFFETGSNAFETADKFTQIHIDEYRSNGRPSLPALAAHHAEKLGLDTGSPEYKAMLLVATRAEVEHSVMPDYHNQFHYTDVAAMTANLLAKNNEFVASGDARGVPLTKQEQALTLMTAIGHDIDHAGKSNPPNDPLYNETQSFKAMEPLMREAGLTEQQIKNVHTILMTTSPNGPHAILKSLAKGDREGAPATLDGIKEADFEGKKKMGIDPATIKPLDFPVLKDLEGNSKLTQMAAMVSDADLYASGGAGMASNMVMSTALTDEGKKFMGSNLDFTTDGSRKFFLDGIVGKEGYASNAGREVINAQFEAMRNETEQRLAAAKAAQEIKPTEPPVASKFAAAGIKAEIKPAEVKRTPPKPRAPGGP